MRTRLLLLGLVGVLGCQGQERDVLGEDEMDLVGDAGLELFANLASEDCRPVGNYAHEPASACCPGLHQVEQRLRVFSDDGTSTCSFSPVHAFACVEGFCGDGRCEAAEAVACGCSLDCPIAED